MIEDVGASDFMPFKHIAIIPDGNGRYWLELVKQGVYLDRDALYKLGARKGIDIARTLVRLRIADVVTILVSTKDNEENREPCEIEAIHSSLEELASSRVAFEADGIRVRVIDSMKRLHESTGPRLSVSPDHPVGTFNLLVGLGPEDVRENSILDLPPIDLIVRTGSQTGSTRLNGLPIRPDGKILSTRKLWPELSPDALARRLVQLGTPPSHPSGGRSQSELVVGDAMQSMNAVATILKECGIVLTGRRVAGDPLSTTAFADSCQAESELVLGYSISGAFMCRAFPDINDGRREIISLYLVSILMMDLLFDCAHLDHASVEASLRHGVAPELPALIALCRLFETFKAAGLQAFGDSFSHIIEDIVGENGIVAHMRLEGAYSPETVESALEVSRVTIGSTPLLKLILFAANKSYDAANTIRLEAILAEISELIRLENDLATYAKESAEGTNRKNILSVAEVTMGLSSATTQLKSDIKRRRDRILADSEGLDPMTTDLIRRAVYMAKTIYGRRGGYDSMTPSALKRIIDQYPNIPHAN